MEKTKTCCIITNDFCNFNYSLQKNSEKEKIKQKAIDKISFLRENGVKKFISGMEEGIDLFCANFIENTKTVGEFLECAVAFEAQAANYGEKDRDIYFNLCENCETLTFVSRKRNFGCKTKRDRYMIEQSDAVLCFWDKLSPYTGELLQYAATLNKEIVYI